MPVLQLSTEAACGLAIGRWPRFRYDARGGGGCGVLAEERDGWCPLHFAPDQLTIPQIGRAHV